MTTAKEIFRVLGRERTAWESEPITEQSGWGMGRLGGDVPGQVQPTERLFRTWGRGSSEPGRHEVHGLHFMLFSDLPSVDRHLNVVQRSGSWSRS